MPKISIFLLNSSESRGESVIYKRVNRNTVHLKGSAAYNWQFNGSRDGFRIQVFFNLWFKQVYYSIIIVHRAGESRSEARGNISLVPRLTYVSITA